MKYFFKYQDEIKNKISNNENLCLMFDFDGALSAIAPTPAEAFVEPVVKKLLSKLAEKYPLAIISGRELEDVKAKVCFPHIDYSGNHGMEWEVACNRSHVKIPEESMQALDLAYLEFKKLAPEFVGMVLENKKFSFAVHYRLLPPAKAKRLQELLKKMPKDNLEIKEGKKVFEFRPETGCTKGSFAKYYLQYLNKTTKKDYLPVYIGDDRTDEDVFKEIKRGITVRVGQTNDSSAEYYIKNQQEIVGFLKFILQ